jgi:hypothetical protein
MAKPRRPAAARGRRLTPARTSPLTLHPNWRAILKRAWSVRFILLAGLLDAAAFVLTAVAGVSPFSLGLQILAGTVSGAALVARIIVQSNLPIDS